MDGVTVVTVFTGGTHFLAVFAKEAFGAELVAACPVPASVTGDAPPLCDLAGLLTLAVSTPEVIKNALNNLYGNGFTQCGGIFEKLELTLADYKTLMPCEIIKVVATK